MENQDLSYQELIKAELTSIKESLESPNPNIEILLAKLKACIDYAFYLEDNSYDYYMEDNFPK